MYNIYEHPDGLVHKKTETKTRPATLSLQPSGAGECAAVMWEECRAVDIGETYTLTHPCCSMPPVGDIHCRAGWGMANRYDSHGGYGLPDTSRLSTKCVKPRGRS